MILWKTFKIAIQSLFANKLRSFLTMLGIIIGSGAVLAMVSIGKGAQSKVEETIKDLGTQSLFIRPGSAKVRHISRSNLKTLKLEDAFFLKKNIDSIQYVDVQYQAPAQVKFGNKNKDTTIVGCTSYIINTSNYHIIQGRMFSQGEMNTHARVCVLGGNIAEELFASRDPLLKYIRIKGIYFKIIGIFEKKGQVGGWMNPDDHIYVPITTAQKRLFGIKHVNFITTKVKNASLLDATKEKIIKILRKRHHIPPSKDNDFTVDSSQELLSRWQQMTEAFTLLLAAVATISLLVGGIGIMNIMLVTVTERRREIGIRKAVGAKKTDILKQFLIESSVIGILGGSMGFTCGIITSYIIGSMGQWETMITPDGIFFSIFLSLGISIISGMYPAIKAANQHPIEAIRYE